MDYVDLEIFPDLDETSHDDPLPYSDTILNSSSGGGENKPSMGSSAAKKQTTPGRAQKVHQLS